MINSFTNSCFLPRFRSDLEPKDTAPANNIHKNKISSVIVDAFLISQGIDNTELTSKQFKNIESRLSRNILGKRYYEVPTHYQVPTRDEIFNWFIKGKHGQKLYRQAIARQDREVAAFLQRAHVDINQPDKKTGDTPLIIAARNHDTTTVRELLGLNVSVHICNKKHKDPLYEAVAKVNCVGFRDDAQYETIQCLIEYGADAGQLLGRKHTIQLREWAVPLVELRTAKLLLSHTRQLDFSVIYNLAIGDNPDSLYILCHLVEGGRYTFFKQTKTPVCG